MAQPPNRDPRRPQLALNLKRPEAVGEVFVDEGFYEGLRVEGIRYGDVEAERVELKQFVLTEVDLSGAKLDRFDLSSFRFGRLKRVRFEGCRLIEADLQGVVANTCTFIECDLTGAQLSHANFEGCGFRGCRLASVGGLEALKGAQMAWEDVMELATAWVASVGIEVRDDIC